MSKNGIAKRKNFITSFGSTVPNSRNTFLIKVSAVDISCARKKKQEKTTNTKVNITLIGTKYLFVGGTFTAILGSRNFSKHTVNTILLFPKRNPIAQTSS
jgi:hypothetical protein